MLRLPTLSSSDIKTCGNKEDEENCPNTHFCATKPFKKQGICCPSKRII